jgi:hypothetical protein
LEFDGFEFDVSDGDARAAGQDEGGGYEFDKAAHGLDRPWFHAKFPLSASLCFLFSLQPDYRKFAAPHQQNYFVFCQINR